MKQEWQLPDTFSMEVIKESSILEDYIARIWLYILESV